MCAERALYAASFSTHLVHQSQIRLGDETTDLLLRNWTTSAEGLVGGLSPDGRSVRNRLSSTGEHIRLASACGDLRMETA